MSSSPITSLSQPNPIAQGTNRGEEPLRGLRRRLLQTLWSLLVICDLFVLIVSLPAFFQVLHTVCTGPITACFITDQLLPRELITLQQAGISLSTYALAVFSLDLVASLAFLLVGAVIIWRRANTWMGLYISFLLINFGSLGLSISHASSLPIAFTTPVYVLAYNISQPLSILAYLCFAFFFFTFSDSRLVPRWSWALVSLWIVNFVVFAAMPDSPLNINNWSQLLQACWLCVVFGGSLSTQVYRFRRVASLQQRQQIKWIIYGFVPILLLPICFALLQVLFPSLFWQTVTEPLYRFYYLPVPVCIGIALLRYHLWDIDVLINRTLIYSLLTATLLSTYLVLVFGGQYLPSSLFRSSNGVVLVGSTLIVAALFQPLRQRVQQLVDRRFYRSKYDAAQVVARFNETLRQEVNLDKLCEQLLEVVQETVQPTHLSLWLRPRKQQEELKQPEENSSHV